MRSMISKVIVMAVMIVVLGVVGYIIGRGYYEISKYEGHYMESCVSEIINYIGEE